MSHDGKFLVSTRGSEFFITFPSPVLWNHTCKYCCQDRRCWVWHLRFKSCEHTGRMSGYRIKLHISLTVGFKIRLLKKFFGGKKAALASASVTRCFPGSLRSFDRWRKHPTWRKTGRISWMNWAAMAQVEEFWGFVEAREGGLGGLSGLRGLLRTWSCWQIYSSLCDHMAVMEMAGAVWVADGRKKKNPF